MVRRFECSFEQKLSAVKCYLDEKVSLKQVAQEHGVAVQTIRQWVVKYHSMSPFSLAWPGLQNLDWKA